MNPRKNEREKLIYRLSRRNKYYSYERYKKYPDPLCDQEAWSKNVAKETKI